MKDALWLVLGLGVLGLILWDKIKGLGPKGGQTPSSPIDPARPELPDAPNDRVLTAIPEQIDANLLGAVLVVTVTNQSDTERVAALDVEVRALSGVIGNTGVHTGKSKVTVGAHSQVTVNVELANWTGLSLTLNASWSAHTWIDGHANFGTTLTE